jgi:hypothetical protein
MRGRGADLLAGAPLPHFLPQQVSEPGCVPRTGHSSGRPARVGIGYSSDRRRRLRRVGRRRSALIAPGSALRPCRPFQAASPSLKCRRSTKCGGGCSDVCCGWRPCENVVVAGAAQRYVKCGWAGMQKDSGRTAPVLHSCSLPLRSDVFTRPRWKADDHCLELKPPAGQRNG